MSKSDIIPSSMGVRRPKLGDTQTCYKCDPPREIGPGQIEGHNKDVHGGGKHLVPHPRKDGGKAP